MMTQNRTDGRRSSGARTGTSAPWRNEEPPPICRSHRARRPAQKAHFRDRCRGGGVGRGRYLVTSIPFVRAGATNWSLCSLVPAGRGRL